MNILQDFFVVQKSKLGSKIYKDSEFRLGVMDNLPWKIEKEFMIYLVDVD